MSWRERTALLIGQEGLDRLAAARVAVFGLGGVGSWAAEALVRAGIGHMMLVDGDVVAQSNLNRQLPATTKTLGQSKVEVVAARALDINPGIHLDKQPVFFVPDNAEEFDLTGVDYIVDAVDMVTAKILLAQRAKTLGISFISVMGTGNKLDPTRFAVTDLSKTAVCPLARIVRKELRVREIRHMDVVYSPEEPIQTHTRTPGSISFVPPAAGMAAAGQVVRNLLAGKPAVPR